MISPCGGSAKGVLKMIIIKLLTKRWGLWCLTPVMLLLMITGTSEAGVKTIWPDKFKPVMNNQNSNKAPGWAGSALPGAGAEFYAKVKLPVGAKITGMRYYHRSLGSDPGTNVNLFSAKFGQFPDIIMAAGSKDGNDTIIPVTGEFIPASDRYVRPGLRYFVLIGSNNQESTVWGIKVFYK